MLRLQGTGTLRKNITI